MLRQPTGCQRLVGAATALIVGSRMHVPRFTLLLQYRPEFPRWGPLAYQSTQPQALAPKLGIAQPYAAVRDVLRHFNAASLVTLAVQALWRDTDDDWQADPSTTLLLVQWALQDRAVALRLGPDMPGSVFDDLRQAVRSMPSVAEPGTAARAAMRSLLPDQIGLEKSGLWGFLRWPALMMRVDGRHRSRRQFRSVFQMEPDTFMDLAVALHDMAMSGVTSVAPGFFAPLERHYGASVRRFVDAVSRDLPALRAELRREAAQVVSGREELREQPYLQRFPLWRDRGGSLHCWHPLVLTRGLEEAVDLGLSTLGSDGADAFGSVFRRYVRELVRDAHPPDWIDEDRYRSSSGPQASAVDAIWREPGTTILIEAALALFDERVHVPDAARPVKNELRCVLQGIAQGWRVASALSQPAHPFHDASAREMYQLIVVSRELYVGTGQWMSQLLGPNAVAPEQPEMLALLPLHRIFIVSIKDFELVMGCVRAGDMGLPALLRDAALNNAAPRLAKLLLADHLGQYPQHPTTPRLLEQARDGCMERLQRLLPDDVDDL